MLMLELAGFTFRKEKESAQYIVLQRGWSALYGHVKRKRERQASDFIRASL